MKRCSRCKEMKPVECYCKLSSAKDGLQYHCRACQSILSAAWYAKMVAEGGELKKRVRATNILATRKWRATHPGGGAAASRKHRRENPEKARARYTTDRMVSSGKLVRGPCRVCGSLPSQVHHMNYADPLDIVWLCNQHHVQFHARFGDKPNFRNEGVCYDSYFSAQAAAYAAANRQDPRGSSGIDIPVGHVAAAGR